MTKKILVALIIIQFVLMGLFLVYALVQRTQALKYEELAKRAEVEAINQAEHTHRIEAAYKKQLEDCMTHK